MGLHYIWLYVTAGCQIIIVVVVFAPGWCCRNRDSQNTSDRPGLWPKSSKLRDHLLARWKTSCAAMNKPIVYLNN